MATILIVLPPWVFAQRPDSAAIASPLPTTVSLLTCAPGEQVYELEGHTALRFHSAHSDITVNWGLFDFDSPNFIYRFVKGETDYMAGKVPTHFFLEQYRRHHRAVVEQTLNLTPAQINRLLALIHENLLHPVYRYNYVKDNCSLRPLRLLQIALSPDSLCLPADIKSAEATFRSEMQRFHRNYPWYQFGIDIALGSGIDYQITSREAAFAPVTLAQLAAEATIDGPDGERPLVTTTTMLVDGNPSGIAAGPTPWFLTPLFLSWLFLLVTIAVTAYDIIAHRSSRLFDALLFAVVGLAGCIVAFLVFVSVHEATSPNALILWLNPSSILVPILIWSSRGRNFLVWYHFINFAAVIGTIIFATALNQKLNNAFLPLMAADIIRSVFNIYRNRKR